MVGTIVSISGLSSEVGKTTLLCNLLRELPGWEAVKLTRGHYRSCGKDPQACCVSHLLSDEPVMIPAFQGVLPTQTFILNGAACRWTSDYWANTEGSSVLAENFQYTVTPSGHVHVRSEYPAEPLACAGSAR